LSYKFNRNRFLPLWKILRSKRLEDLEAEGDGNGGVNFGVNATEQRVVKAGKPNEV
jgi:hypothetical protein